MKQLLKLTLALLLTVNFGLLTVKAQAPQKMSYQAVVRNASNQLITNQSVGMQISILQTSATGTSVYVETQTPTTNANGLVSIEIGTGTVVSGDFTTIDWANGPYFIKTETDINGGSNYTITGTSQLLSVPYALHAKTAESISGGINETDPVFGASVANGITAADTANWNNHTVDTDTHIDSTGIVNLGFNAGGITSETDPNFTAWDKSTGISITESQISDLTHTVDTDTHLDSTGIANYGYVAGAHTIDTDTHLDSAGIAGLGYVAGGITSESDPNYTAWDKSTGISITESQITDLAHTVDTDTHIDSTGIANLGFNAGGITTESDPNFTAWDKSTGISITESQITDLAHTVDTDTHIDSTGIAGLGFNAGGITTETDPNYTAWDKSTGISITESQISDLQTYLTTEVDGSITNELQDISISGHDLSLTSGSTITLPDNVNDADADASNEIQDLQLVGNILTITKNGTATSIDLSAYLDNTDTQLTDAEISTMGYIKDADDVDADTTNEIQNLSEVLTQSNNAGAQIKNLSDPTDAQDAVTKLYVDQMMQIMENNGLTVVDFTADTTSLETNENINFTDKSAINPTTWVWDFGDGDSSSLQNPAHAYTTAGTYSVSLTASNGTLTRTKTKTNYVSVTAAVPPIINDYYSVRVTIPTDNYELRIPSKWADSVNYDVDWGDSSRLQNVNGGWNEPESYHIYSTSGDYVIKLKGALSFYMSDVGNYGQAMKECIRSFDKVGSPAILTAVQFAYSNIEYIADIVYPTFFHMYMFCPNIHDTNLKRNGNSIRLSAIDKNYEGAFGNTTLTTVGSVANITIFLNPNGSANYRSLFYRCDLTNATTTGHWILEGESSADYANMDYFFYEATGVERVNKFRFFEGTVSLNNFYDGSDITVPVYLPEASSFLKVVNQDGMFNNCNNLTDISSFRIQSYNCSSYSNMFSNCDSLSAISNDIFENVSNSPLSIDNMFANCPSLTTALDSTKWWNNSNISSGQNCFENSINISNYANIPIDWK